MDRIVAGCRLGDPDSLREACVEGEEELELKSGFFPEGFLATELPPLLAQYLGDTGEIECLRAVAHIALESEEVRVIDLLSASAGKGWLAGYRVLGNYLDQAGRAVEAEEWAAKAAAAGEASALALFASRRLECMLEPGSEVPSGEGAEIVRQMELAGENGVDDVFIWLARFYARGEQVPVDEEKADRYASAAVLAASSEEERIARLEALHQMLPPGRLEAPVALGSHWLFACADKHRSSETRVLATNAWVAMDLQVW
jgi:TPR repeat protein